MTGKRKQYNAQYKFETALEAAKGLKTINQLAGEKGLHPNQVSQWKRQLLAEGTSIFGNGSAHQKGEAAKLETELYEQIGQLKIELEWMKKLLDLEVQRARHDIEALQTRLAAYERQYSLSSEEFYRQFRAGTLGDAIDFVEWSCFWDMYQAAQRRLNELTAQAA
jgi:transposase-like protein